MRPLSVMLFVLSLLLASGCAASNYDDVDEFAASGRSYAIHRVGACGPLSTAAANEFMYAGYAADDLGPNIYAPEDVADGRQFSFLAIAGTVAYDQPDPLGFSSYAMRVLDVNTGETIWTSEGTYQNTAALRVEDRPVSEVFRDMVADFARTFPPAR